MRNLWCQQTAKDLLHDDLALTVYGSRLLGTEPALGIGDSGCTSVKTTSVDVFGQSQALLVIKGEAQMLETIKKTGFSPLDLNHLCKIAQLPELTDQQLHNQLNCSKTDCDAPNPNFAAILHAIIPSKFVNHNPAYATATITNAADGESKIKTIYGDRVLFLPFTSPGFELAKQVKDKLSQSKSKSIEGILIQHYGLITFSDSAKLAYDNMIKLVSAAEAHLQQQGAWHTDLSSSTASCEPLKIAEIRQRCSQLAGRGLIVSWQNDSLSVTYSSLKNVASLVDQSTIVSKQPGDSNPIPWIVGDDIKRTLSDYCGNSQHDLSDNTPSIAIMPGQGLLTVATNRRQNRLIAAHFRQLIMVSPWIYNADSLPAISPNDGFQNRQKSDHIKGQFEGQIAFVTGAASGIGRAAAQELLNQGACVVGVDINLQIVDVINQHRFVGIQCDMTCSTSVAQALTSAVETFGGIDIVVSNAGTFPASALIDELAESSWLKTVDINLSSHYRLINQVSRYLKLAINPAIVIIGSKNVPAPGPGAAAYSCAKAGLTQLARVAALELAPFGIRVNVLHPNAVFDTEIWTDEILKTRAANYGLTVDAYKCNNLLKTEITSQDVAKLVASLASSLFAKTTGAQIPIDGGNERVI